MKLWNATKIFAKKEDGAVLIEYVTIIALLVAAAIGGLTIMGNNISTGFTTAATGLQTSLNKASW